MILFVSKATDCQIMKFWSSYTRLDDVDGMLKSQREDYNEYVRSAVKQYFLKINIESKIEPKAPQSVRSVRKLSIDAFENIKLMKSICTNLSRTRALQELTLCGFRLTEPNATKLNQGLLACKSVKKLRLNFCIHSREIM